MAKRTLRIGLIGCGSNMTDAHLPRIAADGAVIIAGIADPRPAAADRLMRTWGGGLPSHTDWRRLLSEPGLDGVIISTPHNGHFAQARVALAAGIHVLVEKPLTIAAADSRALLRLAAERQRLLVVAYQRHHMAPFAYARELVRRGRIGDVGGIVGYVTQGIAGRVDWRLDPTGAGGGMFADTGSHLVAAALWVTGLAPRWVHAAIDCGADPVDVNAVVQAGMDNGALASLSTFGNAARHDERLAISGTKGSLVIHMHQWRFRSLLMNDEPVTVPKRVADGTPDQAFFAWIRNGGRGYDAPTYAHHAVKFTEAAYRSAARGERVRLRT